MKNKINWFIIVLTALAISCNNNQNNLPKNNVSQDSIRSKIKPEVQDGITEEESSLPGMYKIKGTKVRGKREGVWKATYDKVNNNNPTWTNVGSDSGKIVHSETYVNSILEGDAIDYHEDGKIAEKVNYSKGLKEGEDTYYDEYGNISGAYNYRDGKRDGEAFLCYYSVEMGGSLKKIKYEQEFFRNDSLVEDTRTAWSNGQIRLKQNFVNGKLEGERILYDEYGMILQKENYSNGLLDGEQSYYQYEYGFITAELNYHNGITNGKQVYYDRKNGVKTTEWNYVEGKRNGDHIEYYANGETRMLEHYKDDKIEVEQVEQRAQTNSKKYASDGRQCSNCNMGHYQGGFCNMCGAAAPDRVSESYSKLPDCPICNGKRFTRAMNGDYIICPGCKGTGKQTF